MKPWPCTVFVLTLIAVAWAPLPLPLWAHTLLAWVLAFTTFAITDTISDRRDHDHVRH
jgi:hypothetical protein